MDKRPYTCCFTGHRNLPAAQEEEIWQRVCVYLEPLLEEGVRYFGVGGALGFDTLVAENCWNCGRVDPRYALFWCSLSKATRVAGRPPNMPVQRQWRQG